MSPQYYAPPRHSHAGGWRFFGGLGGVVVVRLGGAGAIYEESGFPNRGFATSHNQATLLFGDTLLFYTLYVPTRLKAMMQLLRNHFTLDWWQESRVQQQNCAIAPEIIPKKRFRVINCDNFAQSLEKNSSLMISCAQRFLNGR